MKKVYKIWQCWKSTTEGERPNKHVIDLSFKTLATARKVAEKMALGITSYQVYLKTVDEDGWSRNDGKVVFSTPDVLQWEKEHEDHDSKKLKELKRKYALLKQIPLTFKVKDDVVTIKAYATIHNQAEFEKRLAAGNEDYLPHLNFGGSVEVNGVEAYNEKKKMTHDRSLYHFHTDNRWNSECKSLRKKFVTYVYGCLNPSKVRRVRKECDYKTIYVEACEGMTTEFAEKYGAMLDKAIAWMNETAKAVEEIE